MKRIYHPYNKWECFQHHLYVERNDEEKETRIMQSVSLLKNPLLLQKYMDLVSDEWTHSCEVYFSHKGYNRRAWLGQAACCYCHGASEDETKKAWNYLSEEEQIKANAVADEVIANWEKRVEGEKIS